MILSLWCLFLGRLIVGFGAGLLLVATSIYMKETLPSSSIEPCLTSFNLGINVGILLITFIQGVTIPPKNSPGYTQTKNWRIGFGTPIFSSFINFLMWWLVMKYESLQELIQRGKLTTAQHQLHRIYKFTDKK
jgi:MFS family permease